MAFLGLGSPLSWVFLGLRSSLVLGRLIFIKRLSFGINLTAISYANHINSNLPYVRQWLQIGEQRTDWVTFDRIETLLRV